MNKPVDYNHVYLYAKHHYKRANRIEDLRVILSKRSWVDVKFISANDVINCLLGITWIEINRSGNPAMQFGEFVKHILPENRWQVNNNKEELEDLDLAIVSACLSILSLSIVKDDEGNTLIELGEPDSSILPLRKEQ